MTAEIKLVKIIENGADVDSVSLTAYTDGFNLALNGWAPALSGPGGDPVAEALTTHAQAASDDTLAANFQKLAAKRKEIMDYLNNPLVRNPVVLRVKLKDETGSRQALIHRFDYQVPSFFGGTRANLLNVVLGLERGPYWEDTALTTFTFANVGMCGGMVSYSGNTGDLASRLAKITIEQDTDTDLIDGGNQEFWLGFKTARYGNTVANFAPVWSLRLAGNFSSDTTGGTSNPDSPPTEFAYDGYQVVCTFATETSLVTRLTCSVSDITANGADQKGRYKVLLRAKVTSGSARVRLGYGFGTGLDAYPYTQRVLVENDDYKLFDMGNIDLASNARTSYELDEFDIIVQAEQVSGSGSLKLDCLIWIPLDDGFIYFNGVNLGTTQDVNIREAMDGNIYVDQLDATGNPIYTGSGQISGGLPVENGVLILAANNLTRNIPADNFDISMQVAQRWEMLRGVET